jgi:gamma-glutamylcysteine synthetase
MTAPRVPRFLDWQEHRLARYPELMRGMIVQLRRACVGPAVRHRPIGSGSLPEMSDRMR